MIYLIDTNVLLDVLLKREPFYPESTRVFNGFVHGIFKLALTVNTITDLFYVLSRRIGRERAKSEIQKILMVIDVIDVTQEDCVTAMDSRMTDYEDAVMARSALRNGIDRIITRNETDFQTSGLLCYEPKEIIEKYGMK